MAEPVLPIPTQQQENVSMRLRRIEGQVRGIQRMVDEGRDCREIVNQVVAVRAALSSLNAVLMECYVRSCLDDPECAKDKNATNMIEMMIKATR